MNMEQPTNRPANIKIGMQMYDVRSLILSGGTFLLGIILTSKLTKHRASAYIFMLACEP